MRGASFPQLMVKKSPKPREFLLDNFTSTLYLWCIDVTYPHGDEGCVKNQCEGMMMRKKATVLIVTTLLLAGGFLALLPTPAWAPTGIRIFNGDVVSVTVVDGVAGIPWGWVRVRASNTTNDDDITNPGDSKNDGDKRF